MATKTDYVMELRQFANGAVVITRKELAAALGYKDPHTVDKFLRGIAAVPGTKKYLIKEVAEAIMKGGK